MSAMTGFSWLSASNPTITDLRLEAEAAFSVLDEEGFGLQKKELLRNRALNGILLGELPVDFKNMF
jgi:hypothetical protein